MAWAKNDHLGFDISYASGGVVKKYRPDFIVRLKNDKTLVMEVKGIDTEEANLKRKFLQEWVTAVNTDGGFGVWCEDIIFDPDDLEAAIDRHCPNNIET